jgi:PTH1 family peptidyl-tRNA hydrolase
VFIVGLGNPGSDYQHTWHNIGFKLIDAIVLASGTAPVQKTLAHATVYHITYRGKQIRLAKPNTYMNLSGIAVAAILNKYKLQPHDICIAFDDFDLPFGRVRLRLQGSPGTHNGMKSVIEHVGTQKITRLRLGIGPKPTGIGTNAFVLTPLPDTILNRMDTMLNTLANEVLQGMPTPHLMNRLNAMAFNLI